MNSLKIYKSSAGSGKTFTLVLEYLLLVLQHPEDYKAILAITFTNKAAEEMKHRIIDALVSLSRNEESPIRKMLELKLPGTDLTVRSGKALKNILHDYSSFSVCTIDSFFQRILRALAREIHLPLKMQVEVELDDAILDVTDRLMKDVGVDQELTDWLTKLSIQKMDDDKGWNLEKDIESVARELFKEKLHNTKTLTREEIHRIYDKLKLTEQAFEKKMKQYGGEILDEINKSGFSVSDFSFGKSGVAGYFQKICISGNVENYMPKQRVLDAAGDPEKWTTKKSPVRNELIRLAERILIPRLREVLNFVEAEFRNYMTSKEILKKIYLFGIVNDLQKKFSDYRNEKNVILLSDTTRLLHDVIDGNDAPFLYEKTGNRYKHLLIDEFQDTSLLQWKNLLPLIINTLGSGYTTLVVGDAKQSIYRWRGGNMNLLLQDLFTDLKNFKSLMKEEVLGMNYRSKKEIVDFNNSFFSTAPELLQEQAELKDFQLLQLAYGTDLKQSVPEKNESGGYVKIKFLENIKSDDEEDSGWKNVARKELLNAVRELLGNGYAYKDICILVRKNSEGNEIANFLFENGIEEILSPDSLLLATSPTINFLINVLRFLNDTTNIVARSEILFFYECYLSGRQGEKLHTLFADHKRSGIKIQKQKSKSLFEGLEENQFNQLMPEAFTAHLSYLGKLPVYELSEQLVSIFNLNKSPDAYIQRFQDLVLEYSAKTNSSLDGFLQWWDNSGKIKNCSVVIPENTDAIRIMTIHGSKGLQFPVVLMPYTEWQLLPKANEIIWMKTGSAVEGMEMAAVTTGSRLKETHFSEEYTNEVNQTMIDNLNLLYVAFTRAEKKLYVFCPEDNEKDLTSVSKLIYRTCKKMDPGFSGQRMEIGTDLAKQIRSSEKGKEVETEPMLTYPVNRWQGKLALSTHSGNLLSMLEDKRMNKINYGILVHAVLAEIKNLSEIDIVVDRIVFEGLIGQEEKRNLKNEIREILTNPEIASYFDPSCTVFAERDLILPGGETFRPDRVIIIDNAALVIDFKTGRFEKKHEAQVKQYADILRSMKYKKVEVRLVYLAERKIVKVD